MAGLTPKQTAFLAAYIGEARGVGVKAARIAGYAGNDHTLRQVATENLSKPDIASGIEADKARVRAEGIAIREQRVKAQNERWAALQLIVAERAADESLKEAAGHDSGFMVLRYRGVGSGEDFTLVREYAFDKALFDAFQDLEQHTAKELGQWVDKQAATDPTGEHASDPHTALLSRIAELAARAATYQDNHEPPGDGGESPPD